MGLPILVRQHLYSESGLWFLETRCCNKWQHQQPWYWPSYNSTRRVNTLRLEKKWQNFYDNIFQIHFLEWKYFCVLFQISEVSFPRISLTSLVKLMVWRLTCDKPLPKSMMTQFTAVSMQYQIKAQWVHPKIPELIEKFSFYAIMKCYFENFERKFIEYVIDFFSSAHSTHQIKTGLCNDLVLICYQPITWTAQL